MSLPFILFVKRFLHSFSQVMLQEKAVTGLLLLVGLGLSSFVMLLAGVLATLSGLMVARFCHFNLKEMQSGLYGFNSALVGIATFYFLPSSPIALLLVIFSGILSSLIMHFMATRLGNIPALTTPFILTTWLILAIIDYLGLSTIVHSSSSGVNSITLVDSILAAMRGVAQVMLQDSWLSGVIFLCALACNSIKIAASAFIGSVLGMLMATGFNFSQDMILMGVYGFNSCLVVIAISMRYPNKYWLTIIGSLVSVLFTRAFEEVSLPALTAPFVLTIWFIIGLSKVIRSCAGGYART